jgi:hypothetical protein
MTTEVVEVEGVEETRTEETRTEEMIAAMLAEVEAGTVGDPAPVPGSELGAEGQVLNRELDQAGESLEMPMVTASHSHAGYVYVYHIPTGDRRPINKNMLPSQLKKLLDDGSPAFSLRPIANPTIKTAQRLKCILHTTDPNRSEWDSLGFPVCAKANLTSLYQVDRHMQRRHRDEWAAMEKNRETREREEDRAAQKLLYTAVSRSNRATSKAKSTAK